MKIIFEKNVLNNVLNAAMSAVSTKNIIPATAGIYVIANESDSVTVTSYDLEKGITTTVPAKVIEQGEYVINAVRLNQIVKTLSDGEITIEVDDKCMTKITSGRSEFSMPALPGSDFPSTPTIDTGKELTISQSVMRSLISRTIFAVAQTDQRPVYCGVYFEVKGSKIVAVSCDSFRLAYTEHECEIEKNEEAQADMSFIIPGKTLIELMKFLDDSEDEVIKRIAEISPKRVVYVSCGPDSLARDCAVFKSYGFEIGKVYPVNMFPGTGHVESVVCLTRSDKAT